MHKFSLEKLFAPKSIAIIGASDKPGKVGTVITENVSTMGYAGQVYYVNQAYENLNGKPCYPSIAAIGAKVDLAVVAVPAKFVAEVIQAAADYVKNYVIISAGFSETGIEGKEREENLAKLAERHQLNILGPNCLGFIVPGLNLNASFAGGMPQAGNIAFVSQSGALAVAIMDIAKKESLTFSNIISIGNKMQLGEAQLLEYLENDDSTKVIGMYLEGIKDGQAFIEAAGRLAKKKPVVVLKAGKTEKSQKAISSHTGALAGSDIIMDVAFEKAGVMRAETLDDFFALLKMISVLPVPQNDKVAVVTNAGGAGVLTTDAFKGKEIVLAEIPDSNKEELRKILPAEASVENPIDVLGDAQEDRYAAALESLDKEDIATIICVLTPQDQTPVMKIADVIVGFKQQTAKNVCTLFIGGERISEAIARLESCGVPNFTYPEQAIDALDAYFKWSLAGESGFVQSEFVVNELRRQKTQEIITGAKKRGKKALLFCEAAELMNEYGILAIDAYDISSGLDIPRGVEYPVVAKVDSDTVLHKTDRQGLILGIGNEEELEAARKVIAANFPGEKIIAQPMRGKHAELILGIIQDDVFGPVVAFGLGGIYTEVFKMVDFLIPPMSEAAIIAAVAKSKIAFLFEGVRGQAKCDIAEFARIVKGLMEFSLEVRGVAEFDINPLFVYNDGKPAIAVDIKVIF